MTWYKVAEANDLQTLQDAVPASYRDVPVGKLIGGALLAVYLLMPRRSRAAPVQLVWPGMKTPTQT